MSRLGGNGRPPLAYVDIRSMLATIGNDLAEEIVLVGGQAVSFWKQYLFQDSDPLTSKDIDFVGNAEDAQLCAVRLSGRAVLPGPDHVATPSVAVVLYVDAHGVERMIDFISAPFGIAEHDLRRTAVPFDVFDDAGAVVATFFVMHPVLCMESRVHNTMRLPGYRTPHALEQLKASIECAREFLAVETLPNHGQRPVLKWYKRIFRFCLRNHNGRQVALEWPEYDPFSVVVVHPSLSPQFKGEAYPRMVERVNSYRSRMRALQARQSASLGPLRRTSRQVPPKARA